MKNMDSFYSSVSSKEYDNGLKFLYKNFPSDIVAVSICFATGSSDEAEFLGSGLAHITEHLVFEGRKDLEDKMRAYGASSNAYTTFDHTLYYFEVPKKNLNKTLEIFIPAIFSPEITEEVFSREKEVVLKEAKFRDDNPASRLSKIAFKKSYRDHPYGYPIIGETQLIKKVTLDDLIKFHSKNYVPNNAVISIAGDLDYKEVDKHLEGLISGLRSGCVRKESFPDEERSHPLEYTEHYPGKVSYIFISFPGVSMFHSDLEELDFLSEYLSWGKDAPIYKRFLEKGICYSMDAVSYTPYSQGLFGFFAVLEDKNIEEFKKEFKEFLSEIKKGGFDEKRIQRLKKKVSFEFLKEQETPIDIAQSLSRSESLTSDYKYELKYLNRFLSVDKKNLSRVADEYLNLERAVEVRLLPEVEKEEQEGVEFKKRSFQKIEYDNGLKVILSDSDVSPITVITVIFEGGLRAESKDINGISKILPNLLITSELEHKFLDLGAVISPISGNNSIGFSIQTPEMEISETLSLMAELLKNPEFKKDDLEVIKNIQIGKIKDSEIDLFYQASKVMREAIFKEQPYRMMSNGTPESVGALEIEDIYSFKDRIFTPANCVISIAGGLDKDSIEKVLKRELGEWKGAKPELSKVRDLYPEKQERVDKFIPQREVLVEIGFMVPEISSNDRYVMDLIQMMVTGQGSLFFNRIRRDLGGAYALGGMLFLGPDPGIMSFYVATTPDKESQVLEKMLLILDEIRSGDIAANEIVDAKEMLRSRYLRDIITNSSVSFRIAVHEILGIDYKEIDEYLEKIEAVSKEDIVKFLEIYIDPMKAAIIRVGKIEKE
ncbi:MAG: pitrilysin family protein [Candidatus Kaelpia aquatica]|nr:pitrilysin family protein [Candidatus Kaelpia aquatica]